MKAHILKYVLFFFVNIILFYGIVHFFIYEKVKFENVVPAPFGTLQQKLEYYKIHKKEYNLVFIGDSRTFTNINNRQIDSILNTSSFNMAMWSNRFPTNYAFLQDFLPQVPNGTTLVLSLGYINFTTFEVQDAYPIARNRVNEYLDWGFSLYELRRPFSVRKAPEYKSVLVNQLQMQQYLTEKMDRYLAVFNCRNRSVTQKEKKEEKPKEENGQIKITTTSASPAKDRAQELIAYYSADKEAALVQPIKYKDAATSIEIFWKRGNYWRIELDSAFFVMKRKEDLAKRQSELEPGQKPVFTVSEHYWKNFEAITKLLKLHSNRLHIIYNYIEEAPYTYIQGRKLYSDFETGRLKNYVTSMGIPMVKADVTDMPDYYYFDNNHLTDRGSIKYSQKLAPLLKEKLTVLSVR